MCHARHGGVVLVRDRRPLTAADVPRLNDAALDKVISVLRGRDNLPASSQVILSAAIKERTTRQTGKSLVPPAVDSVDPALKAISDRAAASDRFWTNQRNDLIDTWVGGFIHDVATGNTGNLAVGPLGGVGTQIVVGTWPGRVVNILFPGRDLNSGGDELPPGTHKPITPPAGGGGDKPSNPILPR